MKFYQKYNKEFTTIKLNQFKKNLTLYKKIVILSKFNLKMLNNKVKRI